MGLEPIPNELGMISRYSNKKEKASNPFSANAFLAIMLGGVPVSINNPPVLEPKAIGINNFEGTVPIF